MVQAGARKLSLIALFHAHYLSEIGNLLSFYYYFSLNNLGEVFTAHKM